MDFQVINQLCFLLKIHETFPSYTMNMSILNDNTKHADPPMKLFKFNTSDNYWGKDVDLWAYKLLLNNFCY